MDKLYSKRYQDYVIKDGKYIGLFDEMYRFSAEIPWHQDKTVNSVFSDLTVTILKHHRPHSLLDIGCGLGYMTKRFKLEIPSLQRIVGFDVSETAIIRARDMFADIEFFHGNLDDLKLDQRFDVVVSKDVIFYVINNLSNYINLLNHFSNRLIYLGQSFPEKKPFYGEEIISNAHDLLSWLRNSGYRVVYSVVETDANYSNREYVHILFEVNR